MEIITTRRLRLRTWRPQDFDTLYEILSDPITMSHWPAPYTEDGVREWLARAEASTQSHGYARWCCERLQDNQVVGDIGLLNLTVNTHQIHDLGYIIHHPFWRSGYAFEAAAGIVQWSRERGLERLVATMATDNLASAAVARKLGMNQVKIFNNDRNAGKPTYWFELDLTRTS